MKATELKKILDEHLLWVNGDGDQRADLRGADLRGADLRRAYLQRADLQGADLQGAYLPITQPCPDSGAFIAWKKVGGRILKLQIPATAERLSAYGSRKCRSSSAKLIAAWDQEGNKIKKGIKINGAHNGYVWVVGELHEPDKFCDDRRIECSSGLHFFITRAEAENW